MTQPFFTKAQAHEQDNQLENYLLQQLATVPKGSRFDGVTNMFDAVVRIYELTPETERAELHPFFKMFHDMAHGINTVSIDDLEQMAETETPQHFKNTEAAVTGKINTSIEKFSTASQFVNQ